LFMSQKPSGPLRYDSLSRIAFIRPTIDAQKAPTWSCRDCYRDSNFACRLACFCGFRPGKSHEDKAWQAYRKAQAVPLPNSNRSLVKAGPPGNAWEKPRGAKAKAKDKAQEAPSKEMATMRAQIAKLERDTVPIESLRLAIAATQGLSAADLLKELSANRGEEKPLRKPPKHSTEAERRTKKAQTRVDKSTKGMEDLAADIAKLQEARQALETKLAEETKELELAKQEQKQVRIDQLAIDSDDAFLCVAPADLAGDEAFEQARKLFAAEVTRIQEAKAKANQDREMRDVGPSLPLDSPPVRRPAANQLPQPSSEEDLLKAGLDPQVAKHTAEQLADQHRAAGGRERSRSRSRG